jgi:hypothetical protein
MTLSTLQKARILGVIEYLDFKGIPYHKADVFKWAGLGKTAGWKLLREAGRHEDVPPSTSHSNLPETRGRKRVFSESDLDAMEKVIEDNGWDGQTVAWEELPAAAGLDVTASRPTIQRAMRDRGFRWCLVCHKSYISPAQAERRLDYARTMLEQYPMPQDWYHVRFSNEAHFGRGSDGRALLIRRPWERDCADCIQGKREPEAKDLQRCHAWAAVGYDFKSPLIWYDVPGKPNGTMSLQVYRDSILEPVVGSWIKEGQQFVLEEDDDAGHGTGKSNIVRSWKKQNDLKYFFNCSQSPDIPPIEKAWRAPKEAVERQAIWSDEVLKNTAEEGWQNLSQQTINRWIIQIPDILEKIVDTEGKMGPY